MIVKAKVKGKYKNIGRNPGEIFEIKDSEFDPAWMEGDEVKEGSNG